MPIKTNPSGRIKLRVEEVKTPGQFLMHDTLDTLSSAFGKRPMFGCLIDNNPELVAKLLEMMHSMPIFFDEEKSEFMGYEVGFAGKDFWISAIGAGSGGHSEREKEDSKYELCRNMQEVFFKLGVSIPDKYFGGFAVAPRSSDVVEADDLHKEGTK